MPALTLDLDVVDEIVRGSECRVAAAPTPHSRGGSGDRESLDDPYRRELQWREKLEALVMRTREEAGIAAHGHDRAARKARKLYQLFGLPTVIIPLAGSVAAQYLPEAAVTVMLLASGVCAGINAFLNYGQKAQMHYEYAARWAELGSNVDFEMAKSRADRTAADVFLERLRNRSAALRGAEPPV